MNMSLLNNELLDRMYIIVDMYDNYILEHASTLLTQEEKETMLSKLWEQYQLIGQRISEINEV